MMKLYLRNVPGGRAPLSGQKKWKLVKTIDQGLYFTPSKELFNLESDPAEEINLYEEEDVRDELELRLTRWFEKELGNKPNPIRVQSAQGLPARRWVEEVWKEMNISSEEWVGKKQRFI